MKAFDYIAVETMAEACGVLAQTRGGCSRFRRGHRFADRVGGVPRRRHPKVVLDISRDAGTDEESRNRTAASLSGQWQRVAELKRARNSCRGSRRCLALPQRPIGSPQIQGLMDECRRQRHERGGMRGIRCRRSLRWAQR